MKKENTEIVADRIEVNPLIKSKFIELFRSEPMIVHSPGRINLIGEHTDYNDGFVMPAAIDKGIQIAIAPSTDSQSIIYSVKYDEYVAIDHNRIERNLSTPWANYFLGILHQVKMKGMELSPFTCVFHGDLPVGAGLSSSAALECAFATAINELNRLNLTKIELIHVAQWAEHNYVGVKCGIMDQFASMMGKRDHAILLDCRSLAHEYLRLNLNDYHLVLCDTNVKHSLASSEYNTRRMECQEGVSVLQKAHPDIKSLRDATPEIIESHRETLPPAIYNRCLYVTQENDRVIKGANDLRTGKLTDFGKKMFETHEGLSSRYEVSCPELDFLVEKAAASKGVIGSRMMGGGFGGCTLNIVHHDTLDEFVYETEMTYREHFRKELTTYVVRTANGTMVVENPFLHRNQCGERPKTT